MFEELLELLTEANCDYSNSYDEAEMVNIRLDCLERDKGFAYIEEFTSGSYKRETHFKNKTTKVEITFGKFIDMGNTAAQRGAIRQEIESEIVIPFIDLYDVYAGKDKPTEYRFTQTYGRFDANEVSITIQFDAVKIRC